MTQTDFSFSELEAMTPGLSGPERMEVFYRLPPSLQYLAWRNLRIRFDDIANAEMHDKVLDGP